MRDDAGGVGRGRAWGPRKSHSGVWVLSREWWEAMEVIVAGASRDWIGSEWVGVLKYGYAHVHSSSNHSSQVEIPQLPQMNG